MRDGNETCCMHGYIYMTAGQESLNKLYLSALWATVGSGEDGGRAAPEGAQA